MKTEFIMNLKNLLLSTIVSCCTLSNTNASESFTFSFDNSEYSYSVDNGRLSILPTKKGYYYYEDTTFPALPIFHYCILLPSGCKTELFDVKLKKELIFSDIEMEACPSFISTNDAIKDICQNATNSWETPVVDFEDRFLEGYHYYYMEITPFIYDIKNKNLYFVSEACITLNQQEVPNKKKEWQSSFAEEIAEMIINPEDILRFYPPGSAVKKETPRVQNNVDYLIVTSNSLASAFSRLANWKSKKGLRTEILTISNICANYPASTIPLSIKRCLYDYYTNKALKWVLLGGDVSNVPSLMCTIKETSNTTNSLVTITTPADLFYACFGGTFNWDGNDNGIFGETSDNISLNPNIYISRVPARTTTDVNNFTNKVIAYETNAAYNPAVGKILFAAADYMYQGTGKSELQKLSEKLYNDYVEASWAGTTDFIYDNESTIPSIGYLNTSGLFNALDANYHIVDINAHGEYSLFNFRNKSTNLVEEYNTANVDNQTNSFPSIIITPSCQTNRFDNSHCLSRAFLCDEHGAVAYFGSSRKGYQSDSPNSLQYSHLYDANFYSCLFNGMPSQVPYHFASIAAKAKAMLINSANNENSPYRWLQFSINPLGDPELPLYTSIPYSFSNASIVGNGTKITVNTGGIAGCTIALTSIDNGNSYFEVAQNVDSYTFDNVLSPFTVTISKHNYVTFVSDTLYTANATISGKQIICDSEQYSINYSAPVGFNMYWSFDNQNTTFSFSNINQSTCTVSSTPNLFGDANLCVNITNGSYYSSRIASKQISTYGPLTMNCSQGSGSCMGHTYLSRDNIAYNTNDGFVVNPTCTICLASPNLKYMTFSHEGVYPTSFSMQGDDKVMLTLPYQSNEYQYYLCGSGDNNCNDFRIKFTVSPTQANDLDLNMSINRTNTTLEVAMGYFSQLDSTNPVYLHNNWNLWVYKADSGLTIFNGTVNGMKSFNTTNWASGIYIVRAEAEGQIFVRQLLY